MQLARLAEAAAWAAGLVLLSCYASVRVGADRDRLAGIRSFERLQYAALAHSAASIQLREPFGQIDQSSWSRARVRAFEQTNLREAPEGILRIPALGIVVPIYHGTTRAELDRGVGHIEGTAALGSPGNVGIAGHRDGFFRGLRHTRAGQFLYLETLGRTRRYRVIDTRVVSPSTVSVLAPTSGWDITLVTCYPFYFVGPAPLRFIVRAELDPSPLGGGNTVSSEPPREE